MLVATSLIAIALSAPASAGPPELHRVAIEPDDDTTTHNIVLTFEPGEVPQDWESFVGSATLTDLDGASLGLVPRFTTPQLRSNGRYRTQARVVNLDPATPAAVLSVVGSHAGGSAELSMLVPVGDADVDGVRSARVRETSSGLRRIVTRTVTEGEPAAALSTVVRTQDGGVLYDAVVTSSRTQYSLCAVATFDGDPVDGLYPTTTVLRAGGELLDTVQSEPVAANDAGDVQWQADTASGGQARLRFTSLGDGEASVCVDVRDGDAARVDSVDVTFLDSFEGPAPDATTLTLEPAAVLERFVERGEPGELAAAGNIVEQALLASDGSVIDAWTWTGGPEAQCAQRTHPIGLRLGISKGWE